jgi:CRISPR-associated protein (Cas_Cas02710)
VLKGTELKGKARLLYRMVDDPMEISDAFHKFELALSDLEALGYGRELVLLDATGGTTPMRLGTALAAMTRGVEMVHQRVPQVYVDRRWERDESREVEFAPMGNPLEATGLLREGQAIELFNRRDYGAAALVFGDIASKVSGAERGHYYRGLLLLSEGYAAWDEAVLRDLLQKRNHSILAHGLQPIEKKSKVRFLEYVDALVEAPEARVGAEHARLRGL